jgi:hypothetical protein
LREPPVLGSAAPKAFHGKMMNAATSTRITEPTNFLFMIFLLVVLKYLAPS